MEKKEFKNLIRSRMILAGENKDKAFREKNMDAFHYHEGLMNAYQFTLENIDK